MYNVTMSGILIYKHRISQKMFRQKAVDEISENIVYPLKRTSPIPSVKNAEELKERFDSIFDEDLIRIITSSDIDQWSEMGWRGIMLDDGILWMDYDGKITAVNYQSKYEKKLAKKLTSKVKVTYPRICDITSKGKYINLRQKIIL